MTIVKRTIPLLVAAIGLSLAAYADNPGSKSSTDSSAGSTQAPVGGVSRDLEKEFRALDRDGDGYLSRSELEQNSSLSAKFEAADKNRDGKLDLSEFQALEAEASPDRSLGSAPPATGQGAAGGTRR